MSTGNTKRKREEPCPATKRRQALCPGTVEYDSLQSHAENQQLKRKLDTYHRTIELMEKEIEMYKIISEVQQEQEDDLELYELIDEHNSGLFRILETKYNTICNKFGETE